MGNHSVNFNEVVEKVGLLVQEHYMYTECGKDLAKHLDEQTRLGLFKSNNSPENFIKILNHELYQVTKDKHLSINYTEEPHNQNDETKSDEFDKAFNELMKLRNYGFFNVDRKPGNIGYLDLRHFVTPSLAGERATHAMNVLSDTYALIIDLRENGGGDPTMVSFLISYLLDEEPVHLNSFNYKDPEKYKQFWSLPYVPGNRYGSDKPIYVLTSNKTFSAAEEFAYDLQQLKRATIIGDVTGGAANPGGFHHINPHYRIFIPFGAAENPITKDNWEGKGVQPDIKASKNDAYKKAFKLASNFVREQHLSKDGLVSRMLNEELEEELEKMFSKS